MTRSPNYVVTHDEKKKIQAILCTVLFQFLCILTVFQNNDLQKTHYKSIQTHQMDLTLVGPERGIHCGRFKVKLFFFDFS